MSGEKAAIIGLLIIVGVWLWLKLGKYIMTMLIIAILVALAGCFVVLHSFQSIGQAPMATVRCSTVANIPHAMVVELSTPGGTLSHAYSLSGDRWMLQSSVVEVQPWLYFMGVTSGYTLDRLDGQFDDVNAHSARPIELGGFSLYKSTDAWRYLPLIKSTYGNGVIEPCDGRTYNVFVDKSGKMSAERK